MSRRKKADRRSRNRDVRKPDSEHKPDPRPDAARDKGPLPARRKVALWKRLLFTLVVLTIVLGGAEVVCRVLGLWENNEVEHYIADWDNTWDSDFYVMSTTEGENRAHINSDGLRDRQHSIDNPAGATRIVCLGDSVTFGYLARPMESYPALLQQRLDEQEDRYEVFNMALPGWSTRQQRYAYERIARKYRPDYVILGVCLNDIPELRNNLVKPPAWLSMPYRHSALVRALVRPTAGEIYSVEELFSFYDEPRVQDAWDHFFAEVRLLKAEVEQDGGSLILILFPFRFQVMPHAPEPVPQATMAEFAASEEIPYFDMLPTLLPIGYDGFIDYDHLTPDGAALVAERIAQSGLLKPK